MSCFKWNRTLVFCTGLLTLPACSSEGAEAPALPQVEAGLPDPRLEPSDGGLMDVPEDAVARDASPLAPTDAGRDAEPVTPTAPLGWKAGPKLAVGRYGHTATALEDGRVLLVGGRSSLGSLDSVEVLSADGASSQELASLPEPRSNHGAVLLKDGRVLVVGGGENSSNGLPTGEGVLASCMLFDPVANLMTPTGALRTARSNFALARLADGRVLVVGGVAAGGDAATTAEAYDPTTGSWAEVDAPAAAFPAPNWTTLADGRVVLAGALGMGASGKVAAVFDGSRWTSLPALGLPRYRHSMAAFPSGKVAVFAGLVGNGMFSPTVEVLSSDLSGWVDGLPISIADAGDGAAGGTGTAAVTVASGRILVTGSYGPSGRGYGASRFAGLYDEQNRWTDAGRLVDARATHSATVLRDGRVLLAGGLGANNVILRSTEISSRAVE